MWFLMTNHRSSWLGGFLAPHDWVLLQKWSLSDNFAYAIYVLRSSRPIDGELLGLPGPLPQTILWDAVCFLQLAYSSEFSDLFISSPGKNISLLINFLHRFSHEWTWANCSSLMNIFILWFWCHIEQTLYAVNIFTSHIFASSSSVIAVFLLPVLPNIHGIVSPQPRAFHRGGHLWYRLAAVVL